MKKTLLSMTLTTLLVAAGSAAAIEQRPILTLEVAKKMAAACEARAKQEGWKMNIAVLDSGGNLKHFSRMDDSFLKSIDIAMIKAQTSAGFPFSTKQVGEIAATRVPGIAYIPGIATFEGGLPIMTADGKHIGSIGVSGAYRGAGRRLRPGRDRCGQERSEVRLGKKPARSPCGDRAIFTGSSDFSVGLERLTNNEFDRQGRQGKAIA